MNSIIEINNISKKYNITHQKGGYVALRDVLTNVAKSPFSFLKHKAKQAVGKETKEEFWALKNINLTVNKGDAIGIIGANGAGKSTLLKILSKITPPTTGEIKLRGSVSSLLEVGTGFHPELTGRENIFLNGAILGMTKKEIINKFDDIVEFAGINKFLDTPVKRYSSGMSVRLAFSVAAHMEPDILIVDEVLAVGDADFQKKCLGKMGEVTKKAGRTILFVSHNMGAIQNLCNKCILLEAGRIISSGAPEKVIGKYLKKKTNSKYTLLKNRINREGDGYIKINNLKIKNQEKKIFIKSFDKLKIYIEFNKIKICKKILIKIAFIDTITNKTLFRIDTDNIPCENIKNNTLIIETDKINLAATSCNVNIGLFVNDRLSDYIQNATILDIASNTINNIKNYPSDMSTVLIGHKIIN